MLVLEFEMFVRPDLVDLLIIVLTYNKCLYTVDTFRVDKTGSFFIIHTVLFSFCLYNFIKQQKYFIFNKSYILSISFCLMILYMDSIITEFD